LREGRRGAENRHHRRRDREAAQRAAASALAPKRRARRLSGMSIDSPASARSRTRGRFWLPLDAAVFMSAPCAQRAIASVRPAIDSSCAHRLILLRGSTAPWLKTRRHPNLQAVACGVAANIASGLSWVVAHLLHPRSAQWRKASLPQAWQSDHSWNFWIISGSSACDVLRPACRPDGPRESVGSIRVLLATADLARRIPDFAIARARALGSIRATAEEASWSSRASLLGQVPTRLAPARRYLYLTVSCRVWGKKQRPRSDGQGSNGNDRRSTSMALAVAMRALATLVLLLALVLPAAAEPLRPALKQAQCPVGSMLSGGYCTPLLRSAPPSAEKRGLGPRSPLAPRKAVPQSPYAPSIPYAPSM
jgi:hypothetical protein